MSDLPTDGGRTWMTRLRDRRAERRAIRADRRARRRGRMGGNPDDAARQAESGNWRGGYFTTKTQPKEKD